MLKFREIREDNVYIKVEPIGVDNGPLPKGFILEYADDELNDESIHEPLLEKLDEHDFGGDAEYTHFMIYFDDIMGIYKIEMDVSYFLSEDDPVPEIEEVERFYRPLFEDFYKKNILSCKHLK